MKNMKIDNIKIYENEIKIFSYKTMYFQSGTFELSKIVAVPYFVWKTGHQIYDFG